MSTGTGGFVEVERTFDVEVDAQLPDLVTGQVAAMGEAVVLETRATLPRHRRAGPARAGVTMRRREGGDDDGWHIKVSAGDGARLELHRPLGKSAKPPAAVRRLLTGLGPRRRAGAGRAARHGADPDPAAFRRWRRAGRAVR
jgi:hypothetical protein